MSIDRHDAEYVRVRLRAAAEAAGGQRALAKKIGCDFQLVNAIIKGRCLPCGKPLEYLGLKKLVTYEEY